MDKDYTTSAGHTDKPEIEALYNAAQR